VQNDVLKHLLSLIDLTSLNESDTVESITALCQKAVTPLGHVAAVCVYPAFVPLAAMLLSNPSQINALQNASSIENTPVVKIATVANFPTGNELLEKVLDDIQQSQDAGAEEIDVVFPYQIYLAGKKNNAIRFIKECKKSCNSNVLLKVILETGVFPDAETITQASRDVLLAGADFIKTSTGKIAVGATPLAVTAMLTAIKDLSAELKRPLGLKISGGVRTVEQAIQYYSLAESRMGPNWLSPCTFRIGASQLVDELQHPC
jgi:deoxyribose-phosphate aldolase